MPARSPAGLSPLRLNSAIAWLFMIGASCFVVGSVPAYINAIGGTVDGVTYFVGSLFFTSASFLQLLQAQSPAMTGVTAAEQTVPATIRWVGWHPHDPNWVAAATQFPGTLCFNVSTVAALAHNATVAQQERYVWRPDLTGSILFLVSSGFALSALGGSAGSVRGSQVWRIAWLNMVGSILFMVSALASYILPTEEVLAPRISVLATLLGAACFLAGAALMLPAWRNALLDPPTVAT